MSSLAGADVQALLTDAAGRAGRYLAGLDERPVAPDDAALAGLAGSTSRCRKWRETRPGRWPCSRRELRAALDDLGPDRPAA